MVTAMAYPDKEKGGRGKKSGLNPEFINSDQSYINKARYVLRNNFTPEAKRTAAFLGIQPKPENRKAA